MVPCSFKHSVAHEIKPLGYVYISLYLDYISLMLHFTNVTFNTYCVTESPKLRLDYPLLKDKVVSYPELVTHVKLTFSAWKD